MGDFCVQAITESKGVVIVRPITLSDGPDFLRVYQEDLETFAHFSAYPEPNLSSVEEFISDRNAPGSFCHAICIDGEFVGSSSVYDIRQADRALEIGYTFYAPRFRGTRLNPLVKQIMIGTAIERFGAMRVQLKTGSKNLRSQKAMENIGLTREGTLRNHVRMPDGSWRDTVFFSVVPPEWPGMKARLTQLIETKPAW